MGRAVRVGRGWPRSRLVVGMAVKVGRGVEPEGRWVAGRDQKVDGLWGGL